MANTQKYKRRIKLIKPGIQLRLIGAFVGLSALSFLLQALVLARRLSDTATQLPEGGSQLMSVMPDLLKDVLIFSFGLCLPLTFAVGVLVTFRIAGPVYRFEKYLAQVARGEATGPCYIRKGDQLQDLCDQINAATESIRKRPAARPVHEERTLRPTG